MKNIFRLISLILIFESCENINMISAGSYPYSERYTVKILESEVINRILKFKEKNPDYKVPNLSDHRSLSWYRVYFYLTDKDKVLSCWTRSGEDSLHTTTIAL